MAQPAEFEEKEYEQPLNFELLHGRNIWTPGQAFENHFGIDSALFTIDSTLATLYPGMQHLKGVIIDHFRWGYLWKKVDRRALPTFKANLLLQIKRPHHRKGRKAIYVPHGITGDYWKFEITKHQQKSLERLHHKLANRAIIAYACAAFHTHSELYHHTQNGSLVEYSTFV